MLWSLVRLGLLALGERSVFLWGFFCPQSLFVFHFMRKKGPERLCYRRKLMKKFGSLRERTKEDDEPFRKEGSIVLKHKKYV